MNDDVERNARVRARAYRVGLEPLFSLRQIFPRTARRTLFQPDYLGAASWTKRKKNSRRGIRGNRESYAKISRRKQGTLNARVTKAPGLIIACQPAKAYSFARIVRRLIFTRPMLNPGPPFRRNYISAECESPGERAPNAARRVLDDSHAADCRRGREGGTERDRVFYFGAAPAARGNEGNKAGNRNAKREVGNYAITSAPRVRGHLCARRDWIAGKICAAGR